MKNLTAIALALLVTSAGAPLVAVAADAVAVPYADATPHMNASPDVDAARSAASAHRPGLDCLRTIELDNAEGGRWSDFGCTTLLLSGVVYIVLGEGAKQPRLRTQGHRLLAMSQIMCV